MGVGAAAMGRAIRAVPPLALALLRRCPLVHVPATWRQGRCGEQGMPRGARGGVVNRACHVAPSEVW